MLILCVAVIGVAAGFYLGRRTTLGRFLKPGKLDQ